MKEYIILLLISIVLLPVIESPETGYYYIDVEREDSYEHLQELMSNFSFNRPYEENIFDCSDMSAELECYLENEGYHALFGLTWEHMWVFVETDKGLVAIEVTNASNPEMFRRDEIDTVEEGIGLTSTGRWVGFDSYFRGIAYENVEEVVYDGGVRYDQIDWWN